MICVFACCSSFVYCMSSALSVRSFCGVSFTGLNKWVETLYTSIFYYTRQARTDYGEGSFCPKHAQVRTQDLCSRVSKTSDLSDSIPIDYYWLPKFAGGTFYAQNDLNAASGCCEPLDTHSHYMPRKDW